MREMLMKSTFRESARVETRIPGKVFSNPKGESSNDVLQRVFTFEDMRRHAAEPWGISR
jgi:hypothetical protein